MAEFNFADVLRSMRSEEKKRDLVKGLECKKQPISWGVVMDEDGEPMPGRLDNSICQLLIEWHDGSRQQLDCLGVFPLDKNGNPKNNVEIVAFAPDGVKATYCQCRVKVHMHSTPAATETQAATEEL